MLQWLEAKDADAGWLQSLLGKKDSAAQEPDTVATPLGRLQRFVTLCSEPAPAALPSAAELRGWTRSSFGFLF